MRGFAKYCLATRSVTECRRYGALAAGPPPLCLTHRVYDVRRAGSLYCNGASSHGLRELDLVLVAILLQVGQDDAHGRKLTGQCVRVACVCGVCVLCYAVCVAIECRCMGYLFSAGEMPRGRDTRAGRGSELACSSGSSAEPPRRAGKCKGVCLPAARASHCGRLV